MNKNNTKTKIWSHHVSTNDPETSKHKCRGLREMIGTSSKSKRENVSWERDQTDRWIDPSVPYGVFSTHPSPIQLITEKGQRDGEMRIRPIIFVGMLTPTASVGLISIPLAQTLQECYCVSVRGASSWWAAMPAWKERQFHIWSGNLLPLTKTHRLAPSCIIFSSE